jgi:hypothetical protein
MNKALPFIVLGVFCLGCGFLKPDRSGVNGNTNQVAANAALDAERSKKFYEIYEKRAELGIAPKKVLLTDEPYLKGKVLFLKTRKSQPPIIVNESPVIDKYSMPPPPNEDTDPLKPIMAVNLDEIDTIVLIEDDLYEDGCKEVDKNVYESKDGKALIGAAQVCEVTIIDTSIPAVVFRKTFEGKLKEKEYARDDDTQVLARVERKEIYDFLANLPRK